MHTPYVPLLFVSALASALGACSGGGSSNEGSGEDDAQAGNSSQVGTIVDTEDGQGVLVSFGIEGNDERRGPVSGVDPDSEGRFTLGTFFFERAENRGGLQMNAQFSRPRSAPVANRSLLDRCSSGNAFTSRQFYLDDAFGGSSIGDSVVLSSDAGTFATLERLPGVLSFAVYSLFLPDTLDVPDPLAIAIPDASFPMPAGLAMPQAMPLRWVEPLVEGEVGIDSVFRWEPGDAEQSFVKFKLDLAAQDGNIVNSISCNVVDDGEFSFAGDEFNEFVFDQPRRIINLNAARVGVRFVGSGSTAFELFNTYHTAVIGRPLQFNEIDSTTAD